ncbi:hypothetical protein ACHHYP_07275 [Achlya hypogyna]|uniref:Uncharacterized protein n=1 Tax=Achlya hypogyna TaxID=1202772 RepID=A0A1V9YR95_ACHHY|nr:hypothetical protein ACHHYP_07275 [Achlya hypogyna]
MERRKPKSMFDAGISSKFTRQYHSTFHDTTLDAATAARLRAERKLEAQQEAIERQRLKIDAEILKIEEAKKAVQRKKLREAKRIETLCHSAAVVLQSFARRVLVRVRAQQEAAATRIGAVWRMHVAMELRMARRLAVRTITSNLVPRMRHRRCNRGARRIQSAWRAYASRLARKQTRALSHAAATAIQAAYRGFVVRETYLDVLDAIVRFQALYRGHAARSRRKSSPPPAPEPTPEVQAPEAPAVDEPSPPRPTTPAPEPLCVASPANKVLLPSLPRPRTPQWTEPERRVMPTKQMRQRRKTIAVTLSPMPYRTVLIHQTASNQEDEARRREHEALRRKVLQQQYEEKQRQMERYLKQTQIERESLERACMAREERRSRVIAKTDTRLKIAAARKAVEADRQRMERELNAMEQEERASRLAWKWLQRKTQRRPRDRPAKAAPSNQDEVFEAPRRKARPPPQKLRRRAAKPSAPAVAGGERTEADAWADDNFDDLVDETHLDGLLCQ